MLVETKAKVGVFSIALGAYLPLVFGTFVTTNVDISAAVSDAGSGI